MSEKLPSLQFYPGDWHKDPGVRSLSLEEKGAWFEMLLLMHESEQRGKLLLNGRPMTDDELANVLCVNVAKVQQIVSKLVANGIATKEGDGTLVNRRMIRDDNLYKIRRAAGRIGGLKKAANSRSKTVAKATPSVSSSSSSSKQTTTTPLPPSKGVREDSTPSGKNGDYRITTDLQSVICAWKVVIGVSPDDRDWDRMNWKRNCAPAKKLLDFFDGDWKRAAACAEDVFTELKSKNLDCALTTVCNRAYEWRQKNANDK